MHVKCLVQVITEVPVIDVGPTDLNSRCGFVFYLLHY